MTSKYEIQGKVHWRFIDGSPTPLVPGTVIEPTPQELAAFPEKFKEIPDVESDELSPEEFNRDPVGFVSRFSVQKLNHMIMEGILNREDVKNAELQREKPRKTLIK